MGDVCIKLWTVVKEDILLVALDWGKWTLWKFHAWVSMLEVKAVVTRVVEEFESMLKSVEVEFVRT